MKKTVWLIIVTVLIVFTGWQLYKYWFVSRLPQFVSIFIDDSRENPVIFDVWINERPFKFNRLSGGGITVTGYQYASIFNSNMNFKVEWIELLTNRAFRTERIINFRDLNDDSIVINVGYNGEINFGTDLASDSGETFKLGNASFELLERQCVKSYDNGSEVLEKIRTRNLYLNSSITLESIDEAIQSIHRTDNRSQFCDNK